MTKVEPCEGNQIHKKHHVEETNFLDSGRTTNKFFNIFRRFALLLGLFPVIQDKETGNMKFRLFSLKSLLSLFALLLTNLPLTLFPLIVYHGGFSEEEIQSFMAERNQTLNTTLYEESVIESIVQKIEYSSFFLYYVLPFFLSYNMSESFGQLVKINRESTSRSLARSSLHPLIPPIMGFLVFLLGRIFMFCSFVLSSPLPFFTSLPLTMISYFVFMVMSPLGLQLILATHELFFYAHINKYVFLAACVMETKEHTDIFSKTKKLIEVRDLYQPSFGFFLLVDLSLMLIYWLIHLYNTYIHFQEGVLAASGSTLVVLAELWRIVALSYACDKFAEKSEQTSMFLEELKLTLEDATEQMVGAIL